MRKISKSFDCQLKGVKSKVKCIRHSTCFLAKVIFLLSAAYVCFRFIYCRLWYIPLWLRRFFINRGLIIYSAKKKVQAKKHPKNSPSERNDQEGARARAVMQTDSMDDCQISIF